MVEFSVVRPVSSFHAVPLPWEVVAVNIHIFRRFAFALAAMCTVAPYRPACADGVMLPDIAEYRARRERTLITEPEQKEVIVYRNGIEDLIISPRFAGPVSRFAWIIPVPSRPTVKKQDGALFHELARLIRPLGKKSTRSKGAAGIERAAPVEVLERKQVGAYDVAVLKADDPKALLSWLKANRFAVTPAAEAPIQAYIKEGWTFVAARVNVPDAARGLSAGTLAPIRMTFRTAQPIYPLRLSAANPDPFVVLVYVIVPTGPASRSRDIVVHHHGGGSRPLAALWSGLARLDDAPTLAKIVDGPAAVHVWDRTYHPRECSVDLKFSISR